MHLLEAWAPRCFFLAKLRRPQWRASALGASTRLVFCTGLGWCFLALECPSLCALQPTQSRRLSEPAHLPAAHAACAALPHPAAGAAAGAVPERQPPRATADAITIVQAERDLRHERPSLLSGTAPDAVMIKAEQEPHTMEPGVQPVAGPDAVILDIDRGDSASAAAQAAVGCWGWQHSNRLRW